MTQHQIQQRQTQRRRKDSSDLSQIPCKFFKSGKCAAGDKCQFSHALENWTSPEGVCKHFLKGTCKFGNDCTLPHFGLTYSEIRRSGFGVDPINTHNSHHQQPLPSPELVRNPAAPIEIRQKSLPDIFVWSLQDHNSYGRVSPHSLFFSSHAEDDKQNLYSKSMSHVSHLQKRMSRSSSPDPFSPFGDDFDTQLMVDFDGSQGIEPLFRKQ